MKRFLALLLVLVMVIGLVACGTKTPAATDPTQGNDPTNAPTDPATPTVNEKPFKGKTIEVWGYSGASYQSETFESMSGVGTYNYMHKAAIDEWAAMNEVTVVYKNSYDVNQLLSAINAGETPDLTFPTNMYPASANYGLVAAFTEEEYNKIAQYTDQKWLDLVTMGGKTYGFVLPWTGTFSCWFNLSMFERYDVKSPLDYFWADEWNWTNLVKAMKEVTKDLDGDGKSDTYGLPKDALIQGLTGGSFTMDEKGRLTMDVTETQHFFDYCELYYNEYAINKTVYTAAGQKITTNVKYPMYAMQFSDCEPYNYKHNYNTLSNGDLIRTVPVPYYDGDTSTTADDEYWQKVTQACCQMLKSCDEREAVVDLMCYILQCGDKYMSMLSNGDLTSKYEGIKGLTVQSKAWLEKFTAACEVRAAEIATIEDYSPELVKKIDEYYKKCKITQYYTFTGVTEAYRNTSILQKNPPASAVEQIKEKYKTEIEKYNSLYIYG